MKRCPRCGEGNPDKARFCLNCAEPFEAPAPAEGRKTVTVVFTDVVDSTSMGERLDPETHRHVMTTYFDAMKEVVERYDGTVEKFIGDAVMAVFGIPTVHEDDALRAIRVGEEMHDAVSALDQRSQPRDVAIQIRTGIQTGEVVAGDPALGEGFVTGDAVNVAARLQAAAAPGEILIGEATYRLVRDGVEAERVGALELKGKEAPVVSYRLRGVLPGAEAISRRLGLPLIGRAREMEALSEAFESARASGTCHVCSLHGPAGIGKTRLVHELLERLEGEAQIARGRCLPYGDGLTFWPLIEILKQLTQISDDDVLDTARAKIASLIDGGGDTDPVAGRLLATMGLSDEPVDSREVFWSARTLLENLGRRRPLVLLFEDIHWAEPTLLDLIEYFAGFIASAPVMLLCTARPELIDLRPDWGSRSSHFTTYELEPLPDHDGLAMVCNLLGTDPATEGFRQRILDAAEGNPLFIEETLRMLIDDEKIRLVNGTWEIEGALGDISVPPTIHLLLSARFDRLPPDERGVLQFASVVGKEFWWEAVSFLAPEGERSRVGAHLQSLVRREFIEPDPGPEVREDSFKFVHILIRDVAYGSIPKQERVRLHQGFVEWLKKHGDDPGGEHAEIIGYHLEQAYRYRSELAPLDEDSAQLASDAAESLASAGLKAFSRNDMPAAAGLLKRAGDLLPPQDPRRLHLIPQLGRALMEIGRLDEAGRAFEEAIEEGRAGNQPVVEMRARIENAFLQGMVDPEADAEEGAFKRTIEEALGVFRSHRDAAGVARAQHLLGVQTFFWGRGREAQDLLWAAATAAREAGDARQETDSLTWRVIAITGGPTPVREGVRLVEEILQGTSGGPSELTGIALICRGHLAVMDGGFSEGLSDITEGRRMLNDLGLRLSWAGTANAAGMAKLLFDLEGAERELREALQALQEMGETGYQASIAGLLAETLYRQGRYDEAETMAEMARGLAGRWDVEAQSQWRMVRAKVLARKGDLKESERLAREGVALMEPTDYLDVRGTAHMSLAEVLEIAGNTTEACTAFEEAERLFKEKGVTVAAEKARARLTVIDPEKS